MLEPNERVEADDGYKDGDPQFVKTRRAVWHPSSAVGLRNRVMARQETAHSRIKNFAALKNVYRHHLSRHQDIVFAATVLTQLSIEGGERLFSVQYNDALWT